MPLTTSHGVFPASSSVRAVSASDMERLYFRSATQAQFGGQQLSEVDRSESMFHLHETGHKHTKYLKKRLAKAPAMDRSNTSYSNEFYARTVAQREYNAGLADSFRKVNAEAITPFPPSLSTGTLYKEDFNSFEDDKMKDSKPPPQGWSMCPTSPFSNSGLLHVSKSHAQRTHHGELQTPRGKEERPTRLKLTGTPLDESYRTMYNRQFTNAAADVSSGRFYSSAPDFHACPSHTVPHAKSLEIFNRSRSVLSGLGR